jgi:nucleoside-diphosphate-sugar epimerase
MRIVIVGGHGQIALLLARQLFDAGHQPVSIIRNPAQVDAVNATGAETVVLDLEHATASELAAQLTGADAVVFAAGAGPGSTAERKLTVDRDGATLLLEAATLAGVARYVMISAMGADTFDADSTEVFQVYLRAKSEADAALRSSDLDWTIVRPGGLTNTAGTSKITIGETTGRGTIPRADVAAVVTLCLTSAVAIGRQFEVISGDTPIETALGSM